MEGKVTDEGQFLCAPQVEINEAAAAVVADGVKILQQVSHQITTTVVLALVYLISNLLGLPHHRPAAPH